MSRPAAPSNCWRPAASWPPSDTYHSPTSVRPSTVIAVVSMSLLMPPPQAGGMSAGCRMTHTTRKGARMTGPLDGRVALVTGATRGAGRGTAVALGEAGATVYCTGRSTQQQRSEYDRPETIE